MRRGEIRWYTFAVPDKRRPALLLTRDTVIDSLNEIIVVPAPRTVRGIGTEVVLTVDDGMPAACALKVRLKQDLHDVPRRGFRSGRKLANLGEAADAGQLAGANRRESHVR